MSHQPLSTRRQLELMRDLQRLATRRHAAREQIEADYVAATLAAKKSCENHIFDAELQAKRCQDDAEAEHAARMTQFEAEYEQARTTTQQEYRTVRETAERERREVTAAAKQKLHDKSLVIESVYEAKKGEPQRRLNEYQAKLTNEKQQVDEYLNFAEETLRERKLAVVPPDDLQTQQDAASAAAETIDRPAGGDAWLVHLEGLTGSAFSAAEAVGEQKLSWLLGSGMPLVIGFLAALLGAGGGWLASGVSVPVISASAVGAALGALVGLWWGVRPIAQKQGTAAYHDVLAAHREASEAIDQASLDAKERSEQEARELIEQRDHDMSELHRQVEQVISEVEQRTGQQLEQASVEFPARLSNLRTEHEAKVEQAEKEVRERVSAALAARDQQVAIANKKQAEGEQQREQTRNQAWQEMKQSWLSGYAEISQKLDDIRQRCDRLFPDFSETDYQKWEKPDRVSMGVEFGRATLDLASIKSGLPQDERLQPERTRFELPAMITLLDQPNTLITAEGAGRKRATELMQSIALRWLTGQPPGKVRLTLLDPVGLGEGFSALMHLADYDENLIATRIWSESRDIEEQLTRLTGHMETVLQKYLRSEYESIHEYNAQAGEVAEPLQLLIVNGFPNRFTDETSRRLASLATNGPRCGVYVLLGIDTKVRLPVEFPIDDIKSSAVHLDWQPKEADFVWRYPAFERLPLKLVQPLPPERMVELVKQIGQAAKDAVRVEVPFEVVAPDDDAMWQGDCSDELRVPIGRAGANRLQYVRLGKGTSQHLLVAGKTGSGKSTFLHALITSAAMHYSPDEVQFYLIDFKKGVEFKSYATNDLPHARVIAIESEREFGHSVLGRLDEELRRRGELYRKAGVQNLADYREAHPGESMPRILLVIDEFQELFVEDDKLAQDATLLMDRLVRQGRAFGMHVLLGTQTLAGAFSIARSTLGQIAVRVALECSEADSHLILSDERNTAARYLSRPGEAIYNDQNGQVSANELFQVVWLPDRERSDYLAEVNRKRKAAKLALSPPVVFEGNAPADPVDLGLRIADCGLDAGHEAKSPNQTTIPNPQSAIAYLGDAVAIKDPTSAQFGRHAGSNLLIVGPQDQAALGMLSVGAVSLAASDPSAKFVALDATRPGDASEGIWQQVAEAVPNAFSVTNARGTPAAINELAEEVARREAESDETAPAIYLIIYNAGRFRDLRRSEDDFSFSMDKEKSASPDKQLAEILKSGPGVGVHALVWCDSYNAVTRLFDRMVLREFALRVVMQVSAADSSNLIDTPAASNLKPHRALFYNDETGEIEKLRPYGLPSAEWLASLTSVGC